MNPLEKEIATSLEAAGWKVLRNGWPDFLCWREEGNEKKVMCVEVKASKDKVRESQVTNHALLSGVGLPVYVLRSPDLSKLDECASLAVHSIEGLEAFLKRADRLEKVLVNAKDRYNTQRQEMVEKFDERFQDHIQQAEAVIHRFKEIANTLMQAAEHVTHAEAARIQKNQEGAAA